MKESESDKDDLLSQGRTTAASDPVLPGRASGDSISKEEVAQKVDSAREQLAELQRRKDQLEREKSELEDLRRKQDEYELGRKEMLEHLTRSLVLLEHEQVETERRVEHIRTATAGFRKCKEQLESIREDQWNNANLKAELTKALAIVDNARSEFNHHRARLDVLDGKRNPDAAAIATGPLAEFAPSENLLAKLRFGDLVKLGFALSLPVIFVGLILVIAILFRK